MATLGLLSKDWLDEELRTDDRTIRFTTAKRQRAVNEGVAEFADLTECYIRQSTIVCSCNTAEYDLNSTSVWPGSSDFVRWAKQGVEYSLTSSGTSGQTRIIGGDDFLRRDIPWLNRYTPGWRQSTSPVEMPQEYYQRADGGHLYLGLSAPPDIGSSEVGRLLVPYVARPAPLTSTGDVPFTLSGATRTDLIPYHRAFSHYAAHQMEKLRGDTEASDKQYQKFMGFVNRFIGAMKPKGAQFVTFARSYLREAQGRNPRHDTRDFRSWP